MRLGLALVLSIALAGAAVAQDKKPGYTDTPRLPGSRWRVHDAERPHPPLVTPVLGAVAGKPPSDAVVLFDGRDLSQWTGRDGAARWRIEDGAMVVNGTGDIATVQSFGDCQLHLEWMAPEPKGDSQGRGNSGVFLMGRYEVQILDSHQNPTYADGQAAALYGQTPPLVNASLPPGTWQTYDIIFRAPRFDDDGKLLAPALVTVIHNGVVVHHAQPLLGATTHRRVARYQAHGPTAPLRLQDHGNPVRFRNIWVRPLGEYDRG